jgi:alkylation response protein AidB-like acyl-CoA dehydrogenase
MDFELNDDQRSILTAVNALLGRHAGPERAIALAPKGEYDFPLDAALSEAGFDALAHGDETGPLEAALVVEAVAQAAGVAALGSTALVAPGTTEAILPGPIAISEQANRGPVRFAAHARTLLVSDGDVARVVALEPGEVRPVASNFGYPMGRFDAALVARGEALAPGSGERMRSWWRVALAAEAVGTMRAALGFTIEYLKQRRQFGRAIGSFQAVQHRLAECAVRVEGSRWLAYEAAWQCAPGSAAATAAAYTMAAADRVFQETHQLSGAIGYTREHHLHVWSMRLQALRLELDGVAAHRRAAAQARWIPRT